MINDKRQDEINQIGVPAEPETDRRRDSLSRGEIFRRFTETNQGNHMTNDSTQDELNQLGTQVQTMFEELEGVEQTVLAHEFKLHDMDADYQETDRVIRALVARFDGLINDLLIRVSALEQDQRG